MAANRVKGCFHEPHHDHHRCVTAALAGAESYCSRHRLRLTELRRRVLELVWASHRPVGAYALLEQISVDGRKAAPPTIYRTLDFLIEHGLIHRIASLNAYIGCSHPGADHSARFFICDQCGEAAEVNGTIIDDAISKDAQRLGFHIDRQTVEVAGVCAQCDSGRGK
ncbi:MAG: Fur family transcriptional regulator [Sedimenticola sp.]